MNCKYCQQELEQNSTICPHCGRENIPEPETREASPAPQQPAVTVEKDEAVKGIVLTPGKLALIICGVVVLTSMVVALILNGMGFTFSAENPQEITVPSEILETESAGTVPTDGDPNDVTCKGSYTVSDEDVIAAMDTVVATAGDGKLTNAQLQIYYWTQVQNFLAEYADYAAYYYGLDYTQPFDTQVCLLSDEGLTWQQYFLRAALQSWHSYQAMTNESIAAGHELTEEQWAEINAIPDSLATSGGLQGFDSAESYLAYSVGAGATLQDYMDFTENYYRGYQYFQSEYEKMMPTDEELDAYFTQYEEDYAASGITRDSKTVDIRHILILPEGATVETIYTETFSEDAWAVGEKNAQDILDQWLAGEASEQSFANFANANSADPGSNTNGGLYKGVGQGEMVEAFDAWCFDESRQVGDYGIVRTELGFHIMYFSGSAPLWTEYAQSDLLAERANALMEAAMEKYPLEVDYSSIKLGFVDMAA